jgi:hypothetical protein
MFVSGGLEPPPPLTTGSQLITSMTVLNLKYRAINIIVSTAKVVLIWRT